MVALYLIPVTLGETSIEQVLPSYNNEIIMGIRHFIVENIRSARRFLRQTDREFPIDDCTFFEMGKHADEKLFSQYLQPLREGKPVGVISEAGCPAVADPGADIVGIAQREGLRVVPLVGPNSMIMAVMSSGLGGQSFAFNGYLPVEPVDRAKRLKQGLGQRDKRNSSSKRLIATKRCSSRSSPAFVHKHDSVLQPASQPRMNISAPFASRNGRTRNCPT